MAENKKVLVVEDNELNLKLFTDLLELNNHKVIENRDGKNVIEICRYEKPNLIIMDIQLPNISGIDIIQSIKIDDNLKNIPIIAVTAFAMKEDKENILGTGCEEYISKPISVGLFIDVIKKYLD